MPLVTEAGFSPILSTDFVTLDALPEGTPVALDLPNDADPEQVLPEFDRIDLIRIPFPSSHDGRGFSLARRLRNLGYRGRLRAEGHVISDQLRYALECGFDEIEISDDLARRQPESHWRNDPPLTCTYRDKLARRKVACSAL